MTARLFDRFRSAPSHALVFACAFNVALLAATPASARPVDYLPPALRADVERLIAETAAEPTTSTTVRERAATLWAWANAFALEGGRIPEDLPLAIGRARVGSTAAGGDDKPWFEAMDGWVRELELKEGDPDALGGIRLSHRGPFPARSWQQIEQVWTVGSTPMVLGGAIRIGIDGFNDQGALQVEDPAGDNYLSIRSSNPKARFTATIPDAPATAGLSLATRYLATFTLAGTSLAPGDTVTITYGDRSGGSRGFEVQSWSIDQLLLPIYLDLEGKGRFMTPRWASVEISGMAEVAAVRAVAPSVVRTGEPFSLAVRSEDRYYNRSTGAIPAYEVRLDGRVVATVAASDDGLAVVDGLRLAEPGVHRFEVRSRGEGTPVTALSNPIWVADDPSFRVFWGDTHGHVQFSEGQGSADHYFRFARDDARLDFVVLSEHDIWLDDAEWRTMRELSKSYRDEGRFLPFLGYEWTAPPARGGHHNVLFRRDVDWRVSAQITGELAQLYGALRRAYQDEDVLVVPHAHAPGDWTKSDPAIERLIEMASTHGTFEQFGNRYLEAGWQVGFIGSTDNHHGHPGYPDTGTTFHTERNGIAAVLAPELRADDVFAALRDIKAYATSGERILLEATLDGEPIGTRLPATAPRRVAARVSGTAAIESIDIVKNGAVAFRKSYLTAPLEGESWVRVSLASSADVAGREPPREYRTWSGSIEVEGARLEEVRAPGLENRHRERVARSETSPQRVDFTVLTRGRANVVLLRLAGATRDTALRIHLDEGRIGAPRPKALVLPAEDFVVRLAEIEAGPSVHAASTTGDGAEDTVTADLVDVEAPLDQTLEWTDLGSATPGDYYYVRVTQIDGARAWSSPFWIGGEPRREPESTPSGN